MINNISIGVECAPLSMVSSMSTSADMLFLYIDEEMDVKCIEEMIYSFEIRNNTKLIMVSGYNSERFHDAFDDVIINTQLEDNFVLTVWSDENFEDSLEEFLEVHGSNPNVESGKLLILANSMTRRMELLAQTAPIGLRGLR